MLSCGCNLSCSYCLLAQSVNSNSQKIQEQTRLSLQNGQFLNNCIKTLKKIGQSPSDICYMQFWGQEPTLNLDLYTNSIKDWHIAFPNIQSYLFSTNGKAYPEKIISFLIELDKYANPNTNVEIQISYDGDFSNNKLRKIDSNTISNNLIFILTKLNNVIFNNLNITFIFNGVVTRELMYELNTIDKINNFIDNGEHWINQFIKLNNNKNITITTEVPMSPEVPYLCSVEDGIYLTYFYNLLKKAKPNYGKSFSKTLLKGYNYKINKLQDCGFTNTTLLDNLNFLSDLNFVNDEQKNIYEILSSSGSCGPNYHGLKIMYDGTLLECHNSIFDTDINFIKKDDINYYIKKNLIDKKRNVNLLLKENENFSKTLLYRGEQMSEYSFFSTLNEGMNLLYLMSCYGQAEEEYC